MGLELLIKGLVEAAKSPLAFVAYIILAVGWMTILWKESRIKTISKTLSELPEKQRLNALKLEYQLIPKKGLNSEQFLKHERRKYFFVAYGLTVIAVIIVITLTIYRYIQIDRANVAQETMEIAYDTFIRGTTTADDNRFKTATGKLEEALKVNPSYAGFINLADIYDEIGNVDGALWASQKAAVLRPDNPSPQMNLGMFYKDKGELDKAESHLVKALELFDSSKLVDDEFRVSILVNLGNVYYEMSENADGQKKIDYASKALSKCYKPALELRGGIRNKRFLANLLGNTANAYRVLKIFSKAESFMYQSISLKEKIAKSSPAWGSLGVGYYNLGDIYFKQEKMELAEKYFLLSKEIFDVSDHEIGKGSVLLAMGEIAKKRGNIKKAKKLWNDARKLFSEHNLGLYMNKAQMKLNEINGI